MIHELHGIQKREYRVDPRKAGRVVTTSAASAADFYRLRDSGYAWFTSPIPLMHYASLAVGPFRFVKTGSVTNADDSTVVQAALVEEAADLPTGFPLTTSASADFVPFAFWFSLSEGLLYGVCTLLLCTFSTEILGATPRTALAQLRFYGAELVLCVVGAKVWAVGYGRVAAMLGLSPRMMTKTGADGALVHVNLKGFLVLVEGLGVGACVCLLAGLSLHPLLMLVVPALAVRWLLQSIVRPAVLQHLGSKHPGSLHGRGDVLPVSMSDLESKLARAEASSELKCVVIALALSVGAPRMSVVLVAMAALAAQVYVLLTRRVTRSLICTELNPQRLELCLTAFYAAEREREDALCAQEAKAKKEDDAGEGTRTTSSLVEPRVNVCPHLMNAWECPLTLPADLGPFYPNGDSRIELLLHKMWTSWPSLKVPLRVGVSLAEVLGSRVGFSTRNKMELVHQVHSSLMTRGVALLHDAQRQRYYVILPEVTTCEGHPSHWSPLRASMMAKDSMQPNAESVDSLARVHAIPSEGPEWSSVARRVLWAYFYAYSHQQAAGFTATTATPPPVPPQPNSNNKGRPYSASGEGVEGGVLYPPGPTATRSPLLVIETLRADGVLDLRANGGDGGAKPAAPTEEDAPDKAATAEGSPKTDECDADGLGKVFERFVALLERQGWDLDRFLVCQEGFTVSILYL